MHIAREICSSQTHRRHICDVLHVVSAVLPSRRIAPKRSLSYYV